MAKYKKRIYEIDQIKELEFSDIEIEPTLTFGFPISKGWAWGVGASFHYHGISTETAQGISLQTGISGNLFHWSVGVSLQNIGDTLSWSTGTEEHRPLLLNIGLASPTTVFGQIFSDVSVQQNELESLNIGYAYTLLKNLEIRSGVQDITHEALPSIGLGLHLGNLEIQYSFSSQADLGNIQKVGLTYEP